jgi:alpha/beta superfamily hydrolase
MIAERSTTVPAGAGTLEARLAVPPGARLGVVISHPHPLYGGDMDSPVVERMVEACASRNLATLRFNFRGVGDSTGRHDEGRGEQDDVRASLAHLEQSLGGAARVALAGYSFGAAISAAVAATVAVAGLALVAPPMRVAEIPLPTDITGPVLVVVGAEDQYCPADALETMRTGMPAATVVVIEGADHFFFGSLAPLGDAVGAWADALLVGS